MCTIERNMLSNEQESRGADELNDLEVVHRAD